MQGIDTTPVFVEALMSLDCPAEELFEYTPAPIAEFEVKLASDLLPGDWIVRDGAPVQLVLVRAERKNVWLQWRGDAHCRLCNDAFVAYLPIRRSLRFEGINGKVSESVSADET